MVLVLNPAASALTVYWPIGSPVIEYSPDSLAVVFRSRPVAALRATMFARGITAPVGSVTVPRSRAVDSWANAAWQKRPDANIKVTVAQRIDLSSSVNKQRLRRDDDAA